MVSELQVLAVPFSKDESFLGSIFAQHFHRIHFIHKSHNGSFFRFAIGEIHTSKSFVISDTADGSKPIFLSDIDILHQRWLFD